MHDAAYVPHEPQLFHNFLATSSTQPNQPSNRSIFPLKTLPNDKMPPPPKCDGNCDVWACDECKAKSTN
ncbi:hypothetical protein BDV32DRAFT_133434 [Aspergillus pseudonomiae]|nr:hypothetical protein BDV32DRAFT_133434 [Aspergillus pseudonomiae]